MASKCPLCPPNLGSSEHDSLWHALQEKGYVGVCDRALRLGLQLDERACRRHFEYHRPRQAPPRKRWRKARALEAAAKLTERQRALVDLCFRVPALGAKEIGQALYWTGNPERLLSAEKSAARDLRRLMSSDIIFRAYLENLPGPGAKPDEISGLYFLGANGRAYVEQLHRVEVERDDWVGEDADLGTWAEVYETHRSHRSIAALQRQLPGEMGHRYAQLGVTTVSWDLRDWLDGRFLRRRFKDPLNEATRLRPTGAAALTLTQGSERFVVPFAYYHDDSQRRLELLLKDIYAHNALARSGELGEMLPGVAAHLPLPALVITSDVSRAQRLLREARSHAAVGHGKPPLALVCDEKTVASSGLAGEVWVPLFGDGSERVVMPAALLQHYRDFPLRQELRWRRG